MSDTISADEAERKFLGRVVRSLRQDKGMTQAQAAAQADVTTQAWQRYEAGDRKFTSNLIEIVIRALGATTESFEQHRARLMDLSAAPSVMSSTVAERRNSFFDIPVWGRVRASPTGPQIYDVGEPETVIEAASLFSRSTGALRLAGESMIPWGEPGELVIFDRDRYPKRGHGCIIETTTGEYYVKLYERSDGSTLYVKELFPEERTILFPLLEVKGVYAVRLRGD